MKSSVKMLIGLIIIAALGFGGYRIWLRFNMGHSEHKMAETLNQIREKKNNSAVWEGLMVLGLWSDRSLRLIESSGVYTLVATKEKKLETGETKKEQVRLSTAEVVDAMRTHNFPNTDLYSAENLIYLGDESMVEKIEAKGMKNFNIRINPRLENSFWWFHQKDPKGTILLLINKEIIGAFHPRTPLMGRTLTLENVQKSKQLHKWRKLHPEKS